MKESKDACLVLGLTPRGITIRTEEALGAPWHSAGSQEAIR
jgi:hypothetical protein